MTEEGKKTVEIPVWLASALLWGFRAAVAATCVTVWTMYLNVRDLTSLMNDPEGALQGSLTRNDWDYEKRLLLIDHELFRTEILLHEMKLEELEDKVP